MSKETTKLILVEDDRWLADCLSETLYGFSIKKITDPEKVFIEIESGGVCGAINQRSPFSNVHVNFEHTFFGRKPISFY